MQQRKPGLSLMPATALISALLAPACAMATDGYFAHGYGMTAKGMGGAAAAMAEDSFGGANNPASMVWVGTRVDFGADWFKPERSAERTGAGFPTLNGKVESGHTNFVIPELAYNHMVSDDLSAGVTIYGNGGMNTTYPQGNFNCGAGPANMLCGSGGLGVDLTQLIIAPTMAYKVDPRHSIGASLLLGYQHFRATGLQAFDNAPGFPPFTSAPGHVTNNGYDSATGMGLRIGYQAHVNDAFTLGLAYSTKVNMSRFDKYKGLFAEGGDLDIPANYSIGVAFKPTPAVTLAADFVRIEYSKVAAVGNSSMPVAPLGAPNGPGFGWSDVSVIKLGAAWRMDESLTLRAGYNHSTNPVQARDVTFNILAPGIVQAHYTLGMTYAVSKDSALTAAFMRAPRKTVTGSSLFNAVMGPGAGGNESVSLSETSLGIAWSRKF
jgi:long-chain fatty acid transport protein